MDNLKSDSEILAEIYRNAQLAQVSITDLLPEVVDKKLKMIQGTVNGITSLKTSLTDGEKIMNTDVKDLLSELISIEEGFERKLKSYL